MFSLIIDVNAVVYKITECQDQVVEVTSHDGTDACFCSPNKQNCSLLLAFVKGLWIFSVILKIKSI